jgi:NAD(P)-dependent dehydrogenase (short-subunit alcohol dehydrogenase family)
VDGEAVTLDITDVEAVQRAAVDLGDIDVLVLTAAMNVRKRILDYSVEEFDRVSGLNLKATFTVLQAFGREMVRRGTGSIVVFSSVRGFVVEPGQSVYAATKAGAIQLVKAAAAEFGEAGVRVNAVAPGVVETPLTTQLVRRLRDEGRPRPLVPAVGACRRGRLPRLGRGQLRHRLDHDGRRRLDRGRRALHPSHLTEPGGLVPHSGSGSAWPREPGPRRSLLRSAALHPADLLGRCSCRTTPLLPHDSNAAPCAR